MLEKTLFLMLIAVTRGLPVDVHLKSVAESNTFDDFDNYIPRYDDLPNFSHPNLSHHHNETHVIRPLPNQDDAFNVYTEEEFMITTTPILINVKPTVDYQVPVSAISDSDDIMDSSGKDSPKENEGRDTFSNEDGNISIIVTDFSEYGKNKSITSTNIDADSINTENTEEGNKYDEYDEMATATHFDRDEKTTTERPSTVTTINSKTDSIRKNSQDTDFPSQIFSTKEDDSEINKMKPVTSTSINIKNDEDDSTTKTPSSVDIPVDGMSTKDDDTQFNKINPGTATSVNTDINKVDSTSKKPLDADLPKDVITTKVDESEIKPIVTTERPKVTELSSSFNISDVDSNVNETTRNPREENEKDDPEFAEKESQEDSSSSSSEEDDEDMNMVTGILGALLGGLSKPDGSIDLEAIVGLIGSLSTQNDDGSYDFSGLTELLKGFFGVGDDGGGGSDIGGFAGGLIGAIIKGIANPPGGKGVGILTAKLLAGILPALSVQPDPNMMDGKPGVKPGGLDIGGFLSGLIKTLFGASTGGNINPVQFIISTISSLSNSKPLDKPKGKSSPDSK